MTTRSLSEPSETKRLRVAMIGYGFMGATHSVGWRQAPRMFDLPADVEMAVVVGRNPDAVAEPPRSGAGPSRRPTGAR